MKDDNMSATEYIKYAVAKKGNLIQNSPVLKKVLCGYQENHCEKIQGGGQEIAVMVG